MNPKILFGLLCATLLTGCLTQSSVSVPEPIKNEIWCPCNCHLTLKRCEIDDPHCKTRKTIEERIDELYNEGYTSKEIVEYFKQPALPSVDELRRQIKAERESKKPVILYFYSETCSTCIKVRPKIEELEREIPWITLFKIEKQFHDAIFSEYEVETYPMLIVLVEGNEYRKKFSEHDDILSFVQEHLD